MLREHGLSIYDEGDRSDGREVVRQMIEHIGPQHPFLVKQEERLVRIRNTLILDLGTALKDAKAIGAKGKTKLLRIVALYGELDEGKVAIEALRESKKR